MTLAQADRLSTRLLRRRAKWRMHRYLAENSPRAGARTCMHSLGGDVEVSVTGKGVSHVAGIARCASVAACILCAPVIRERRAGQIDKLLAAALERGYLVYLLTPTVAHLSSSKLAHLLEAFQDAYTYTFSGRAATSGGYVGQVRAWDYTDGRNGWHPHQHNALVFAGSEEQAEDFLRAAGTRFADRLSRKWGINCAVGFERDGHYHQGPGWKFSQVRSVGDVSGYLTKVDGGWGAGLEMCRNDYKFASHGGRTPWQLLEAASSGDLEAAWRWAEYEAATKGKRQIIISRKLARMFPTAGVDPDESDEQAAAAAPASKPVYSESFSASEWSRYVYKGLVPALLESIEQRALLLLSG